MNAAFKWTPHIHIFSRQKYISVIISYLYCTSYTDLLPKQEKSLITAVALDVKRMI